MNTAVWWIRRDLRLIDNQALAAALSFCGVVYPVFILDPGLLQSSYVGDKRLAFLFAGLRRLDASLKERGSYLTVRRGKPAEALAQILQETGATAIFAEEDYSPYARQRDSQVAETLPLRLTPGLTVYHPQAIEKAEGGPYTVFTPYSRAWKKAGIPDLRDLLPVPDQIETPVGLSRIDLPADPTLPQSVPFSAGEAEARQRLEAFAGRWSGSPDSRPGEPYLIHRYGDQRNRMDLEGTSRLSPYLRFGMISARQVAAVAFEAARTASGRAAASADTFLNEIIWREFYQSILYHFPRVRRYSFREKYDALVWLNNRADFQAWCDGQTGYPVIDAAMRQLVSSGWMHNRARMIVASFLVKDLLIDWRWGERFFMQHLVDGDPAANNGGWQWTAGTGTDAAPYFRVFNPISQSEKFDPEGNYIRRWVPELAKVPTAFIHQPWTMPDSVQKKSGCQLGQDYPHPIVDHQMARQRALDTFGEVK